MTGVSGFWLLGHVHTGRLSLNTPIQMAQSSYHRLRILLVSPNRRRESTLDDTKIELPDAELPTIMPETD
jgi:hypothetical protein